MRITYKAVSEQMANLVGSDRKNPMAKMDPGALTCVYTSKWDKGKHCIVGEILSSLGAPLPDPRSRENTRPFRLLKDWFAEQGVTFSNAAFDLLYRLQNEADETPRKKTWGEVIRTIDAETEAGIR